MSKLGRVGPYTLLERLGRGGMGEVYLAQGKRGDRVALKMLRDPLDDDPDARLRLRREVTALRRVESPYVACVLDADLDGDRPYLVMEHIKGDTLLDAVKKRGPIEGPELVALAHGIATALAIVHAAGVVHRDLKPANVLIGAEGPVLIDFGIAQVVDATRLTMTGTFLGTPGYSAPELFADESVAEPADVHAWAATVAFAATGRPTFGGGTVEAQMYAVVNGKADLDGVPASLLPLLRAALNREPVKRPTAAILADRLARLARAVEAPRGRRPKPAQRPTSTAQPGNPGKPAKRRSRAVGGAASRSGRRRGAEEESVASPVGALPAGNATLATLAVMAVPCVVAMVVWPLATFAVTAAFGVITRAVWMGHWMVRKRRSARVRAALRIVCFPASLAGALVATIAWPGVPAAVAAGGTLWAISGTLLDSAWWTGNPVPVTIAGVVFGVVFGATIGRELERVSPQLPELRKEGLRALAVLGGFVAVCAVAVRVVALLL
ncbi:Serine/threonine protein kinase [Sinosporangium album]|uniref:Serine/threonine protein kinase n=1 Tax=Sinosporangium album TaxID=504805 RepID=A0A1G8JN14_9ACTN|nr:serine/threonine-protein kinase [Sinosporangium album]SDI32644.1 Serine/threonine protein kinase [Sinosporangium album]